MTSGVASPVQTRLQWARAGAALFGEQLRGVEAGDLAGPSLLAGWSRAHVAIPVPGRAWAPGRADRVWRQTAREQVTVP